MLLAILLTTLLLTIFLYIYVIKIPIDGYPYYYKNRLGMIYEDVSTGCLDICLIKKFKRLDVDNKTFEVLKGEKSNRSSPYAKDINSVYYEGKVILGADTSSFRLYDWGLAYDKNTYYIDGIEIRKLINQIDPTITLENENKIELIDFRPPNFIRISQNDIDYVIYYTGEQERVVKIDKK